MFQAAVVILLGTVHLIGEGQSCERRLRIVIIRHANGTGKAERRVTIVLVKE